MVKLAQQLVINFFKVWYCDLSEYKMQLIDKSPQVWDEYLKSNRDILSLYLADKKRRKKMITVYREYYSNNEEYRAFSQKLSYDYYACPNLKDVTILAEKLNKFYLKFNNNPNSINDDFNFIFPDHLICPDGINHFMNKHNRCQLGGGGYSFILLMDNSNLKIFIDYLYKNY